MVDPYGTRNQRYADGTSLARIITGLSVASISGNKSRVTRKSTGRSIRGHLKSVEKSGGNRAAKGSAEHNKYRVRTRSGATYAVSDNDGVCSGCLLSEQISE